MVKEEKASSQNGIQGRVVEIADTSITVVIPDSLIMCPNSMGQLDICSHDDCRKAVPIISNSKGEYVPATGRVRVPCSKAYLRLPVCSDAKGGVRTCNWGSNDIMSHEIGFILEIHDNDEVDIFTNGEINYFN